LTGGAAGEEEKHFARARLIRKKETGKMSVEVMNVCCCCCCCTVLVIVAGAALF